MQVQKSFKELIADLENSYFDFSSFWEECSPNGDAYQCAEFISGCQDIISYLEDILIEKYDLGEEHATSVFNYLYNMKKLKKDYSEITTSLNKIETVTDYSGIEYIDGDVYVEDIAAEMEHLFSELLELD